MVVSDYAKGLLTNDVCREVIAARARRRQAGGGGSAAAACVVLLGVRLPDAQLAGVAGDCSAKATRRPAPENVRRVGTLVSRRFRSSVLLTLGARGMAFFPREGGEPLFAQAEAQEVFDVSGAGDTVVAAFSLARAAGCDHPVAVALANRAAAVVVGKRGTATVSPDELLAADARTRSGV